MNRSLRVLGAVAFVVGGAGCTHQQLKFNTARQLQTIHHVEEQVILNNLAMFANNSNAVPYYAYPSGGTSNVVDSGGLAAGFNAFRKTINGQAGRQMQEAWTLLQVTDPGRLKQMRAIYQGAVFECSGPCEDPWFCVGTARSVPKRCCELTGHDCKTWVWITPSGKSRFYDLVAEIKRIAFVAPIPANLATYTVYVDKDGNIVEKGSANQVGTVQAKLKLGSRVGALRPGLRNLSEPDMKALTSSAADTDGAKVRKDFEENETLPSTQRAPSGFLMDPNALNLLLESTTTRP